MSLLYGVILLGISAVPSLVFGTTEFVVRDTAYGQIRGYVTTVLTDKKVERYLSVPFAAPPVGKLRFEYPEKPTPWEGVLNTTSNPPACPQTMSQWSYIHRHVPDASWEDEDCLYMNIYVPQTGGADNKMEVLVHIHGGSNEVGMGTMFDGDVLAAMGEIIVITFNYRLGPFGFLSAEGSDLPGNYGLFDQVAVLEWVAKNIHFFGGSPDKVTIEGHSAGGGNVGFHIVSKLSKGLFRYAIMQSGSPTAYWALLRPPADALSRTIKFAASLGCHHIGGETFKKSKECLKNVKWSDIINQNYDYVPGMYNYSPVIDGIFIEENIERLLRNTALNGEVYMTGVTRDEGSLTAEIVGKEADFLELTPVFARTFTPPSHIMRNIPEIIDLVVHEYRPWDDPDNKTANIVGLSGVVGDSTFVAPAVDVANRLAERTKNIYFYSFEYQSPVSPKPLWLGVPHGRDQFYLFGCPFTGHPLYKYTDEDREVSRVFINMWSNFVKTGKPILTVGGKTQTFDAYNRTSQSYMVVNGETGNGTIRMKQRLRPREVAFWNSLLPVMGSRPMHNDEVGAVTWILIALCGVLFCGLIISISCCVHYRRLNGSPIAV